MFIAKHPNFTIETMNVEYQLFFLLLFLSVTVCQYIFKFIYIIYLFCCLSLCQSIYLSITARIDHRTAESWIQSLFFVGLVTSIYLFTCIFVFPSTFLFYLYTYYYIYLSRWTTRIDHRNSGGWGHFCLLLEKHVLLYQPSQVLSKFISINIELGF